MMHLDESLVVHGDVESEDDLVIDGRVRGRVRSDRASITISEGGEVTGDVVGKVISVAGHVTGTLTATDLVKLAPTANVRARIISAKLLLSDGARFTGEVHGQQRLDLASSLAQYRATRSAAKAV